MKKKKIENKKDPHKNLDIALIIMPFIIVFFIFLFFKDKFEYDLKKQDLVRVEGVIVWSEVFHKTGSKARYERSGINFKIKEKEDTYSLTYKGKQGIFLAKKHLKINDSVVFYHRHRWQQLIGWGELLRIYYLENNKNLVRDDLTRPKPSLLYLDLIIGSVLLLLWLGYLIFYFVRYKPQHKDPQNLLL